MATFTTKLGLRKPATTDLVTVGTDLSGNFDAIDAAAGDVVCTSATRPATPWSGQTIFETDTGSDAVRSGAAWVYPNNPLSMVTSGARPGTVISGMQAHETDTGNTILSQGGTPSTSWLHPSIPVVASLASIINPYEGQMVLLTTDHNLYERISGAWQLMSSKGLYSRYTGAGTATASGGWTDLPFTTRSDGAGTGLSVASSTTFTLTNVGLYTVEFSGSVNQSGHVGVTGAIFALFSVNTHAANTAYASGEFGVAAGFVPGCVSAEILSNGSTAVLASVFTIGAASVMDTSGLLLPRLSFSFKPN